MSAEREDARSALPTPVDPSALALRGDMTNSSSVPFSYESSLRPGERHVDGLVVFDGSDLKVSLWGKENEHTLFSAGRQDGWSHYLLVSTAPDDFIRTREWKRKVRFADGSLTAFRAEVLADAAKIIGEHTSPESVRAICDALTAAGPGL